MTARRLAILLITVCAPGCASFRTGRPAPLDRWPPPSIARPQSIALLITAQSTLNGNPGEVGPVFDHWREQTVRAYRESKLFSHVTVGLGDADLRAEVNLLAADEMSELAMLLMVSTIGLFPSVTTTRFTLHTHFKDRAGHDLGTFESHEVIRTWTELLLLPIMPLRSQRSAMSQTIYDLNRAVLTNFERSDAARARRGESSRADS